MADSEGALWSKDYKRTGKMVRLLPAETGGYLKTVLLADCGRYRSIRVHAVVALAYLGAKPFGMEVNHKNGIKTDNRPENLEYVTRSGNVKHAFDTGLAKPQKGSANPYAKLTEGDVMVIRKRSIEGGRFYGRKELAKEYGVSEAHIKDIVNRRRGAWSHVS